MFSYGIILLIGCAVAQSEFHPRLDGRIVGGKDADISEFPHQVSFQYNGGHLCGGSIIGDQWVLTAAHCTRGRDVKYISFRAGSTMRNSGGSLHQAKTVFDYPEYNPNNYDFDFSLIKVSPPFPVGRDANVKAIKLTPAEPEEGTLVTVTGWGALSSGGPSPNNLKQVDVEIVARSMCRADYGQSKITDRMICAMDNGKDSCQGDSGGPLINPKTKVLVGVVSWGYGCADPSYPGVYSNIANKVARDWIRDVTNI